MNSEGAQPVARKLIEWADVFLSNITPRVIERWGLTYDKLSEWNPKIIAAYQPMQGYSGPHRDFLGFGAVLTPITGYSYLAGFPDKKPIGVGTNYPDYVINPGHTLVAILAALHYRRRTGKGQLIECAQLESSVAPLAPPSSITPRTASSPERTGNRIPEAAPHSAYKCTPLTDSGRPMDERWLAIACFNEGQWRALVDAMDNPAWAREEKLNTHEGRKQSEAELDANIAAWTADKDAYKLMNDLQSRGIPAGVVQSAREILDEDEHVRDRGYYAYLDHPETGRAAYDGPPFRLSKTPGELRWPGPLLGEHTEYVCKEILRLTDEQIADLMVEEAS